MAAFSTIEKLQKQLSCNDKFQKAFLYLNEAIKEGSEINKRIFSTPVDNYIRIELDDGMFAIEQSYLTKDREDGFFESHRKYIDMQVIISGSEIMEFADIELLEVDIEYDEEKDLITYKDFKDTSIYKCDSSTCAVFWPEDAHMPCLNYKNKNSKLFKTVVKVPID